MKTVAQQWEEFFERVYAKTNPGPNKVAVLRQTFYAGYFVALTDLLAISDNPSEAAGAEAIEKLYQEVKFFLEPKGRG